MNIAIYIYDDAEVLDFSGPFEVFSTAGRLADEAHVFNVFLVAETHKPIQARGNFSVNPHYDLNSHPEIDVLIVPGGVHTDEVSKPDVIRWVAQTSASATLVASVCTGAFILAEAGLLDGLKVTTHWEDIDDLQKSHPSLLVTGDQRWVDEGKFITSAGISAGIDMSLHLVSRLAGHALAEKTARQMAYTWSKNT